MRTATEKEIEFINKYRAKNPMAADAVYVEPFLLINSQFIPKYSMFLHPKAVKQTAAQAGAADNNGLNFKVMHSREAVVALGKSFAGAFDEATSSAYVKFYFPKGHTENGYSVDDLVRGIDAGIYAETSFGFGAWPIKEKSLKCSLCGGNPLWFRKYMGGADGDWCGHEPGYEYPATEAMVDFIAKLKTEDMDSYPGRPSPRVGEQIEARMWMMDTENMLSELSLVDRGASESRPVREDEIPVKFSAARDHPAFQLATSDKGATPADIKALIHGTAMEISIPYAKTANSTGLDDIDLPGGEQGKKSTTNGGEKKVKLKDELKKFFGSIQAELDDPTEAVTQTVVVASAHDTEALKVTNSALMAAGYDGKDLPAFLAGMKSFEADAKKYGAIPEAVRGQIEAATLSWEQVASYIQAVQLELDTACTDYIAAAVAAKGDEVKAEVLKEEVLLKAKAFGVAPALEYCRKMITTLAAGEPVKPGQTTTGQAPAVGEEPDQAARETALRAMAKEAVAQMNKN